MMQYSRSAIVANAMNKIYGLAMLRNMSSYRNRHDLTSGFDELNHARFTRSCYCPCFKKQKNYSTKIRAHFLWETKPRLFSDAVVSQKITQLESTSAKKDILTQDSYVPDFTLHEIYLVTCAEMWDDRPEGARFLISYIDTAKTATAAVRKRLPTALVVEGSMGLNMQPLLETLAQAGFRVVMPSPVGSGLTRGLSELEDQTFSHTLGERSAFLLDFINSIDIESFDVVVGHSFGGAPIVTLASNFTLFKSIALICPIPMHKKPRWIQPRYINDKALAWSYGTLLRPLSHLWFLLWVKSRLSLPNTVDKSINKLRLLMAISLGINFDHTDGILNLFRMRRAPILYVYSEGDKMVDCVNSAAFADIMGVPTLASDTQSSDVHDEQIKSGKKSRYGKRICLPANSSHCPFNNETTCQLIVNEIVKLYDFTQTADNQ